MAAWALEAIEASLWHYSVQNDVFSKLYAVAKAWKNSRSNHGGTNGSVRIYLMLLDTAILELQKHISTENINCNGEKRRY
jgi:hypothetical protein